jgi:hypothetical protein
MTLRGNSKALAVWTHDKDGRATTLNRTTSHLKCTQAGRPPPSTQCAQLGASDHPTTRHAAGRPNVLRLPRPDTRPSLSGGRSARMEPILALPASVPRAERIFEGCDAALVQAAKARRSSLRSLAS